MGTTETIIMVVLVILLIYIIVRIVWRKEYTGSIMKADQPQFISSSDLESSSSPECTYSIWIYIDDLSYMPGKKKVIFHHGADGATDGFTLYLDEYGNNIVAQSQMINNVIDGIYTEKSNQYIDGTDNNFSYLNNFTFKESVGTTGIKAFCNLKCNSINTCNAYSYSGVAGSTGVCSFYASNSNPTFQSNTDDNLFVFSELKQNTSFTTCKVSKIPTQKWVNVVVSISSVSVDMYIDGKLTKTCLTNGTPVSMGDQGVYISPGGIGFSGWNAKFAYWAKYMEPQEIWKIYKNGFEKTFNIGSYQLNMSIYKGDVQKASFTI
jgi:hypothetical protein